MLGENVTLKDITAHRPDLDERGGLTPAAASAIDGRQMEISLDYRNRRVTHHSWENCGGPNCPIHNPSSHGMKSWPLLFRPDLGIFERVCDHGVGHDDPDSAAYMERLVSGWTHPHGCDGCCQVYKYELPKGAILIPGLIYE